MVCAQCKLGAMDNDELLDPENYENEIARAIVVLAGSVNRVAVQLKYLGNADASTPFGAIEALGKEVRDGFAALASAVGEVAIKQD